MISLIDCDAFYASCEVVFRPDLRGRPVIVLSNNDGCLVARSSEAKALGIPDLVPFFQIEHLVRRHNITVFSSNFALYGDLSSRVMETLRRFAEDIEIYSIDEAFIRPWCPGGDYEALGQAIRQATRRDVGIPVSVGMAETKTLAKLATRAAKKIPPLNKVCVLRRRDQRDWLLKKTRVEDIWGVGRRIGQRLQLLGIESAWELANADQQWARREFSVCLQRTIEELNGHACLSLEDAPPAKKQIMCSRTFGTKTTEITPIREATAGYAARVSEKLRQQQSLAGAVMVHLLTSHYEENHYARSVVVKLPYPTDDTRLIVRTALQAIESLYRPGYRYSKSGVGLIDLGARKHLQSDLFTPQQPLRDDRLMQVLDTINRKYGRGTAFTAAEGCSKALAMRQQRLSPRYTTCWHELPEVRC